jgi:hypothetical protein
MPTVSEVLPIPKCPLCGMSHDYDLDVVRSDLLFALEPPPRTWTRFFTCPSKGEMFQAEFQTSGDIKDVRVKSLHVDQEGAS